MSDSKYLEANLKGLSEKIVEYLSKTDTVKIFAYPDPLSFHSSILIASVAAEKKFNVRITLTETLPKELKEGVIVGFNQKGNEQQTKLISIGKQITISQKNKVETISLNPVIQVFLALENISLMSSKQYIAYSSIYQNLNILQEEDPLILFLQLNTYFKIQKKTISVIQTSKRSLLDSLHHTIDPFYPSFSAAGHDAILNKLGEMGIKADIPLAMLSEDEMKKLVEALLLNLSYRTQKQPKKELMRPLLIYQVGEREYDLKEIGEALDIALEVAPGSLFSLYSNEIPLDGLLAIRAREIGWIGQMMREIINGKIKQDKDGFFLLKCDLPAPVHFIGNLARKMEVAGPGSIFACVQNGKRITSLFELSQASKEVRSSIKNYQATNIFPFVSVE
ncbi:MAG: hypothetical protein QW333_01050 [Fervidicoccaceae archaeon]